MDAKVQMGRRLSTQYKRCVHVEPSKEGSVYAGGKGSTGKQEERYDAAGDMRLQQNTNALRW